MADIVDAATRSRMMAGIGSKDTTPELRLRRALHARGFRYRLHSRRLPGRPDLVLSRYKVVIFVHGCFWHRHTGCRYATNPSTRAAFWQDKFAVNVRRDEAAVAKLRGLGWRVAVVWECGLKGIECLAETAVALETWICSGNDCLDIGSSRQTIGPE